MNTSQVVLLSSLAILMIFIVGYVIYQRITGGGVTPSKFDGVKEVFAVVTKGTHVLGNAQLLGCDYALPEQINEALADGLRIPGVTKGMYAMFQVPSALSPDSLPNLYACQDGDFSTNLDIEWPVQSDTVDNKEHTYILFVYGYKPLQSLAGDDYYVLLDSKSYNRFKNHDITSTPEVLPFSLTQWNNPTPSSGDIFGGEEPFLILIKYPLGSRIGNPALPYEIVHAIKENGFNEPSLDQYMWARSRGFARGLNPEPSGKTGPGGEKYPACFVPIMSIEPWLQLNGTATDSMNRTLMNYVTPASLCLDKYEDDFGPHTFPFGYGPYMYFTAMVWGVKKNFPDKMNPTIQNNPDVTTKVLPFNWEKSSVYDK